MYRRTPFLLLLVLVVLAAGALVLSYHQATSAPPTTMTVTCSNRSAAKPSTLVISCADANSELKDLHWNKWGDATAYATGEAAWNDCTPDCAAGTWKHEPVTVWAWRIVDGRYTRLASSDPRVLTSMKLEPYPG